MMSKLPDYAAVALQGPYPNQHTIFAMIITSDQAAVTCDYVTF